MGSGSGLAAAFLDFDSLGPADIDTASLTRVLPGLRFYPETAAADLPERIAGNDVLIVNKVQLDRDVLAGVERLRLICLAATGTDNIDLDYAAAHGIAVCNITDYCTPSVAQHVFALLLALTHHLEAYRQLLDASAWQRSAQFCLLDFPIRELAGKQLGIVGYGALGQGVARVAEAFGMEVVAARRPYRGGGAAPATTSGGISRISFDELLHTSDVISLHCPLNEETRHLINASALAAMKSGAVLINTARGGLVDSAALVEALRNRKIAGAGIDVLAQEPPVDGDPLLSASLPNLIVTPHIAWAARESRQRAVDQIAANIDSFLNGSRRNRVV